MAAEYIGRVISLTSLSDIRYVGTLHAIDKEAATISLEMVRSMGTEGRKGNPMEELPPNDNVYEFIVFRASDVKNLNIEPQEAPRQPPPSQLPQDPAILNSGPQGFDGRPPMPPFGQQSFPGQPPYGFPPPPPQFGGYGPGYSPFGPPQHGYGALPGQQPRSGMPPSANSGQQPTPIAPPQKAPQSQPPQPSAEAPSSNQQPTAAVPSAPVDANKVAQKSAQPPVTAPPTALPATSNVSAPSAAPSKPSAPVASAPVAKPQPATAPAPVPSKPTSFAQAAAGPRQVNGTAAPKLEDRVANLDISSELTHQGGSGGPHGTRRGSRGGQARGPTIARQPLRVPGDDFDFVGANAKFQKDDAEAPEADSKPLYDKSTSFFDNISSDLSQRATNEPFNRQKERQQNVDTFGEAGSFNNFNRRGGRGGRGRGMGRGRGFRGGRGRGQAPL